MEECLSVVLVCLSFQGGLFLWNYMERALEVDIVALRVDGYGNSSVFAKGQVGFVTDKASFDYDTCNLGFCEVKITVGWSLLAPVDLERPNLELLNRRFIQEGTCSVAGSSI